MTERLGIAEFAVLAAVLAEKRPVSAADIAPVLKIISSGEGDCVAQATSTMTRLAARGHLLNVGTRPRAQSNGKPQQLYLAQATSRKPVEEYAASLRLLLEKTKLAS